jgi:peptide/nickel transport system substrate-binding protein
LSGIGFFNPGHYRNPEVDRLLEAGRRTPNGPERERIYNEFQRHLADDAVWAHLVWLRHVYVVRDAYDGIEEQLDPHDHGTLGIYWNLERWKPRS